MIYIARHEANMCNNRLGSLKKFSRLINDFNPSPFPLFSGSSLQRFSTDSLAFSRRPEFKILPCTGIPEMTGSS